MTSLRAPGSGSVGRGDKVELHVFCPEKASGPLSTGETDANLTDFLGDDLESPASELSGCPGFGILQIV